MRKIASNYVYLPAYPLVKNGYIIWDEGQLRDVVDTGGITREIQGLEFYGGMLVAGFVRELIPDWQSGDHLLERIGKLYSEYDKITDLALIQGADLLTFQWINGSRINQLM